MAGFLRFMCSLLSRLVWGQPERRGSSAWTSAVPGVANGSYMLPETADHGGRCPVSAVVRASLTASTQRLNPLIFIPRPARLCAPGRAFCFCKLFQIVDNRPPGWHNSRRKTPTEYVGIG